MKKLKRLALPVLVILLITVAMTPPKYFTDGVYKGESQSKYSAEPYWGQVTVEIKNDRVTLLGFQILDKEKNEVFGPDYERHFNGNALYVDQCRNEVKAIKAYQEAFIKTGNMEQVDAITGATWSYNLFRESMVSALKEAAIKRDEGGIKR